MYESWASWFRWYTANVGQRNMHRNVQHTDLYSTVIPNCECKCDQSYVLYNLNCYQFSLLSLSQSYSRTLRHNAMQCNPIQYSIILCVCRASNAVFLCFIWNMHLWNTNLTIYIENVFGLFVSFRPEALAFRWIWPLYIKKRYTTTPRKISKVSYFRDAFFFLLLMPNNSLFFADNMPFLLTISIDGISWAQFSVTAALTWKTIWWDFCERIHLILYYEHNK